MHLYQIHETNQSETNLYSSYNIVEINFHIQTVRVIFARTQFRVLLGVIWFDIMFCGTGQERISNF
jgi:hypothetical protein